MVSIPFSNIYDERTESIDYEKIRLLSTSQSNRKRHSSISTSSASRNQMTPDRMDEFLDEVTSSSMSLLRRRSYTKGQHLPAIFRASAIHREKRSNQNQYWAASFQTASMSKESFAEPFKIYSEDTIRTNLSELSTVEKQVRSFLETLPSYKGVHSGFDCFAASSLYTNRAPIIIR